MTDQKEQRLKKQGWKMADDLAGRGKNDGPGKRRARLHESWQITTLFESKQRSSRVKKSWR